MPSMLPPAHALHERATVERMIPEDHIHYRRCGQPFVLPNEWHEAFIRGAMHNCPSLLDSDAHEQGGHVRYPCMAGAARVCGERGGGRVRCWERGLCVRPYLAAILKRGTVKEELLAVYRHQPGGGGATGGG